MAWLVWCLHIQVSGVGNEQETERNDGTEEVKGTVDESRGEVQENVEKIK